MWQASPDALPLVELSLNFCKLDFLIKISAFSTTKKYLHPVDLSDYICIFFAFLMAVMYQNLIMHFVHICDFLA